MTLLNIVLLVLGMVVSGGIAFLGNWVGRYVGRRKLSLFGFRPRHTSHIVTVMTGASIFVATGALLLAVSQPVKDMLFHLDQIKADLQDEQRKLADAYTAFGQEQEKLKSLHDEASKVANSSAWGPPLFVRDQPVYLRVVDCDVERSLIEEQINALLVEANRMVIDKKNEDARKNHDPVVGEDTKLVGIAGGPNVKGEMLDKLSSLHDKRVVLLRATVNEWASGSVFPVYFEVHPLVLAFKRGDTIASTPFKGNEPRVDVVGHMENFLRADAKTMARSHGLIQEEPIIDISLNSLIDAQDRIVASKVPVQLRVVANRDIYNADLRHLDARLVVSR